MDEFIIENPDGTKKILDMYNENLLMNPDLFKLITEVEIPKKVVGELSTIKTIFLCSCGRLVGNGIKTSFNLLVNDESGAGKDHVTTKTLEIWNNVNKRYHTQRTKKDGSVDIEDKECCVMIKRTRISEKVFTYWHNPKFEPDWNWDGTIFYNEDISNLILNSDVFKVMASSGSSATILLDQVPTDIEIKGKPVMIITTASANPNPENIRRFSIVNLDTSIDQTSAIMQRQAVLATEGISLEYDNKLMESLKELKIVKVKIPYAEILFPLFPPNSIIMRTFFERFLDYIRASAALHQFQRSSDENNYIIAEPQDYEIGKEVILKLISNKSMIPLTRNQKKLISIIIKMGLELHTILEIEAHVTFMNQQNMRENLDKLADFGLLIKGKIYDENKKKDLISYGISELLEGFALPKFDEIGQFTRTLIEKGGYYPSFSQLPISQFSSTRNDINTLTHHVEEKKKRGKKEDKEDNRENEFNDKEVTTEKNNKEIYEFDQDQILEKEFFGDKDEKDEEE